MKRADRIVEYVRTSYWVIPALGAVLAVAAGLGVVAIDDATDVRFGFAGSAEAARSILSTIAAAMITFTGLVFSITIVALQLASGQFSPRVMRAFLRDSTGKVALATFVATFSFAFTVMRSTQVDAVPGISVTLAIVLVFASIGVFIHFINHTAHAIRASEIIDAVASETRATIEVVLPEEREGTPAQPEPGDSPAIVTNEGDPGVLTGFDADGILAAASRAGAVVVLRHRVGDFVPSGAPMLEVHGADPERCDVAGLVIIGRERTMQQDVAFGLRQLVDLAAKALSPGINDPTTAVQAIDQIHDLLRRLASRPLDDGRRADDEGAVRLVFPTLGWEDYVSLATDEIRLYGADSLQVARRLRAMLEDLLEIAPAARHEPLRRRLDALAAAAEREFDDPGDRRLAAG